MRAVVDAWTDAWVDRRLIDACVGDRRTDLTTYLDVYWVSLDVVIDCVG